MNQEQKEILEWATEVRNFLARLWNNDEVWESNGFPQKDLETLLCTIPESVTRKAVQEWKKNENRESVTPD